jgi:uncharacterized C2H2 Zn-finger protein
MNKKRQEYIERYHQLPKVKRVKKDYYRKIRNAIFAYLGGKCVNCGITDSRLLCINHLKGGGTKEYKQGCKVYWEILAGKREGEFDLRCHNCNILYEYEVGRRKE